MKAIKLTLLLFFFCSQNWSCNFMELNEKEIIKESKASFKKQKFRNEPFLKADVISRYTDFLLKNCDTLLAYHQQEDYKEIQISEGSFAAIKKEPRECFTFLTNNLEFMNYFVPAFLMDSINYYTSEIGKDMIPSFTFCPGRDVKIKTDSIDNVILNLNYVKDEPLNPNYYLLHFIYINNHENVDTDIQSIYEILQKDTVLKDDLKYAIRVIPYTGF